MDAAALARLVRDASDEELEAGFALNGDLILGEIFRRMEEEFRPERARGVDAVLEWRIDDGGGGRDRWQTVIRDGSCAVVRDGDERPDVTLTTGRLDFVKLASGNASGPKLLLLGRLRVAGNLLLAGRIQGMFRVPGG